MAPLGKMIKCLDNSKERSYGGDRRGSERDDEDLKQMNKSEIPMEAPMPGSWEIVEDSGVPSWDPEALLEEPRPKGWRPPTPPRVPISLLEFTPTDVSFVFKEEKANNVEVKAHKVILAMASEVFRREFFGSLKEVKENVIIKNANHEVFHTMIEFIYNKQLNWKDYDFCFLSSLYDLAERYDIEELRKEIITDIPEHSVNLENVLDVAILAESNVVHNQLSEALYNLAVGILKKKFDDKLENALDFFSKTEATEEHGLVLLKIMTMMKNIPSSKCGNCKLASRPCLDGHNVTAVNFVKGANVMHNVVSMQLQYGGDLKTVMNLVKLEENGPYFTGQIEDGSLKLQQFSGYYMYKCA